MSRPIQALPFRLPGPPLWGVWLALVLLLAASPALAGFTLTDGENSLRIGGWVQPALVVTVPDEGPAQQRLQLQRARMDLWAFAHDERVRARVQTEFGGNNPRVLDAFVDFTIHPMARLLVGRAVIPHQNQWGPNPATLAFSTRTVTSDLFAVPGGRDVQIQLHGDSDRIAYGVALVNGRLDGSAADVFGLALTGRVLAAVAGEVDDTELPTAVREGVHVMVGAGGLAAFDTTWRDWTYGEGGAGLPADVVSGFLEFRLRTGGVKAVVDGAIQHVEGLPVEGFVGTTGGGVQGMVAGLLPFAPLVLAARYGEARTDLDRGSNATRVSVWGGGLTLMHRDARWYTRLDVTGERRATRLDGVILADAETSSRLALVHVFRF